MGMGCGGEDSEMHKRAGEVWVEVLEEGAQHGGAGGAGQIGNAVLGLVGVVEWWPLPPRGTG